jgi:hypothetical protein
MLRIARTLITSAIIALLAMSSSAHATTPKKTLQAFASEQELADLLRRWSDAHRLKLERERRDAGQATMAEQSAAMSSPAVPAAKAADAAAADAITNVQHAGVDEGGIVKLHGDHLVILRRGRLFTVRIGDHALTPVSTVDAFGPGIDPQGAWYDEMLIAGNTIVVIGYSYARGGTEIGLFEIDRAGGLRYRSTYHLRSNDYYSSRNYASRLIGSKLIFYTPLRLNPWARDPYGGFPALRRWQPGVTASDFKRIAPATRIYRADDEIDPYEGVALHTVAICDLARTELDCTSTAVLGPPGRVFYVSAHSVFVWATPARARAPVQTEGSSVFRIPLDGAAPSALKTMGSPVDQFSFLESDDGFLNVLLRGSGGGDGMWAAERPGGQLALMRVPLNAFSDGRERAPRAAYRALPAPEAGALQNRYIGPYLIYGSGSGWRKPQAAAASRAYAVRYDSGAAPDELVLPHGVDRIEALGAHAVVLGSDGNDLHFTTVRLGSRAEAAGRYVRANAAQGETRSHGFYYRAQRTEEGFIGLPIIAGHNGAYRQLRRPSASLLYLRNAALTLSELGTLESRADAGAIHDACRASCVDWYGNSRPLFVKDRIFALLGYELVEGRLLRGRIAETRRVNFAPHWIDRLP